MLVKGTLCQMVEKSTRLVLAILARAHIPTNVSRHIDNLDRSAPQESRPKVRPNMANLHRCDTDKGIRIYLFFLYAPNIQEKPT